MEDILYLMIVSGLGLGIAYVRSGLRQVQRLREVSPAATNSQKQLRDEEDTSAPAATRSVSSRRRCRGPVSAERRGRKQFQFFRRSQNPYRDCGQ